MDISVKEQRERKKEELIMCAAYCEAVSCEGCNSIGVSILGFFPDW